MAANCFSTFCLYSVNYSKSIPLTSLPLPPPPFPRLTGP